MGRGSGDDGDEWTNGASWAHDDGKRSSEGSRSRDVLLLPMWTARFAVVMLYGLYGGVPVLFAGMTVWLALRQAWLGAGALLLLATWWGYRGWNGFHGRTLFGPGSLPRTEGATEGPAPEGQI